MYQRLIALLSEYPIGAINHLLLLLPVCVAGYRREYLDGKLVLIALFFLIHFVEESVLLYYVINGMITTSIQKGFLVIDIILLAEFFYVSYKGKPAIQRFSVILSLFIGLVVIANYRSQTMSFVSESLFRLLLICFAILYFNKILAENRILRIVNHSIFWISAGFLIYGMGTFMTSLFTDYLLDPSKTSDQTFDLFWNMSQLLSIIQCMLVSIGLWVSKFDRENYIQSI